MVQLVDGGRPPHVGSVRQQLAAHEHQVERRLLQNLEAHPAVAQDSALAAAALDSAIADAGEAVVATRDLQSQRGRASWLQDRSIGLQDPGATAFLRALEAWRDASTGERGPRAAVVENL